MTVHKLLKAKCMEGKNLSGAGLSKTNVFVQAGMILERHSPSEG